MSIIAQEQRRLDNIYTMYRKTDGDMKKMWEKKWYELVKKIGRKYFALRRGMLVKKVLP
jgi:DNA polymerase III delta prime subunit